VRRRRSNVAVVAAVVFGGVLVLLELLLRETQARTGRTVSGVLCNLVAHYTPWQLNGWACLLVPIGLVFLVALVIDGLASNRR
jgi:hypothetical protein